MDVQPRIRLAILSRRMINKTYAEISAEVGVSEYTVKKVIDYAEAKAIDTSPEDMLTAEFVSGVADLMVHQ